MRKYRICATALAALLLTFPRSDASAEQAVITGNGVNVRTGPGTAYSVSTSVDRNTMVEVLNRANPDWYYVSWDGNSGYISSQFLTLSEADSSAFISVSREETAGYINSMYVCLRSGPDTSSTILGTYNTGKYLTITGASDDWTAVRIDGKDGFVFSQFVTEDHPDTVADVRTDGQVLLTDSLSPSAGGTTIYLLQEEATPTPEATLPPDQIIQVPTNGVLQSNVLPVPILYGEIPADPNISGTVITVTDPRMVTVAESTEISVSEPSSASTADQAAQTVTVLADVSDTAVDSGDQAAATSPTEEERSTALTDSASEGQPVAEEASTPVMRSNIARITGNGVRLRSGPGTTYSIIGTFDNNTEVVISGVSGDWTAVTIPAVGVSGYIHSDLLQRTEQTGDAVEQSSAVVSFDYHPASFEPKDGYITGNGVRLRESPSMSAEILDELNYGTPVRMIGISEDWFRVITGSREGYISASFIADGTYEPGKKLSASTGTELGKEIAAYALSYVGSPYKWGGSTPEIGFDCSGFVRYIYGQFGYETSRVANDALSDGVHVDPADLQPGDLLCFYSGNNYVGHLGIYVGDDLFVHAANSATGVVTTSLTTGYYAMRGYEIRRMT